MIPPKNHFNEKERLNSLHSYSILDSLPEKDYDNLTKIASEICGTPISLVSLIDDKRQWFKSHHGIDASQTPKEYAFCGHAINQEDDIFIIQDARTDERFHNNPLVTGETKVIFYAGVPLLSDEGLPLGTLCVIDNKPKLLSQTQIQALKALGGQVMNLLNLRKTNDLLKRSIEKLHEKNNDLEQFAYIAAHDLKSPLNNILSTSELLIDYYGGTMDVDGNKMLNYINSASKNLSGLIDGLMEYSKCDALMQQKSNVNLKELCKDINGLFSFDNSLSFVLKSELNNIIINRTAINQILINLVSNAIKYNDKKLVEIELDVNEDTDNYEFHLKDNGPGIAKEDQSKIFQIFKTLDKIDKFGNTGNGIGLATVKKIIEKNGGSIRVESDSSFGCTFIFSFAKMGIPSVEHAVL